jgi:hypothetical protein
MSRRRPRARRDHPSFRPRANAVSMKARPSPSRMARCPDWRKACRVRRGGVRSMGSASGWRMHHACLGACPASCPPWHPLCMGHGGADLPGLHLHLSRGQPAGSAHSADVARPWLGPRRGLRRHGADVPAVRGDRALRRGAATALRAAADGGYRHRARHVVRVGCDPHHRALACLAGPGRAGPGGRDAGAGALSHGCKPAGFRNGEGWPWAS